MDEKLSKKGREDLVARHRKERDRKICDRIKAVLAYDDGYSYSEIARLLLLDDETIRRHIENYFSEQRLSPSNGGSKSHLNTKQTHQLIAHLKKETYPHVKDICSYVRRTFGITYGISGMTKWLKSQDFRYKKPHGVPAKVDREKQAAFIAYYKRLKKRAGKKEPIYFNDSTHPHHQTQLVHGWILKGERKRIAQTASQRHMNYMGALKLDGHKIVSQSFKKINSEAIHCFLKMLRRRHAKEVIIHIIWDNAGYHKSKEVKRVAEALNIKLHYLPPYSPNLNPIERLWKIMHEQVNYNRYYENFKSFQEALFQFFRHIGKKKTLLRTRLNDNFHLIDAPNFAS